jgi:LysR substrate binding domain
MPQTRRFDLAVVSSPVRDPALVSTPPFDDEWTVILAPSHALAARPFVSAAELGRETLFSHDAPRSDVERLRELISAECVAMPRMVRRAADRCPRRARESGHRRCDRITLGGRPLGSEERNRDAALHARDCPEQWSAAYCREAEGRLH